MSRTREQENRRRECRPAVRSIECPFAIIGTDAATEGATHRETADKRAASEPATQAHSTRATRHTEHACRQYTPRDSQLGDGDIRRLAVQRVAEVVAELAQQVQQQRALPEAKKDNDEGGSGAAGTRTSPKPGKAQLAIATPDAKHHRTFIERQTRKLRASNTDKHVQLRRKQPLAPCSASC
jgi:hypothetical protein